MYLFDAVSYVNYLIPASLNWNYTMQSWIFNVLRQTQFANNAE
jgi:hypothetical protein